MTVTISGAPVTLDELVAVARGEAVALAADAIERMRASRAVLEAALGRGELVYGVNTGVGSGRDVRLPDDTVRAMQPTLVQMHAGGLGDALPRETVRAVMAARLVGLARGGAGSSPALAEQLAGMLNAGVHPVVPSISSVGSGDLGQQAAVGLVAIGLGRAEVAGRLLPGDAALRAAGLAPLTLEPKDGLALISANGVTLGEGALVLDRAAGLLAVADAVAAAALDAIGANLSVLDPAVQEAKGSPGQTVTADRLRALLAGGGRARVSVQDPLSFRVVPQVHGACRDVLGWAGDALTRELNAAADNPLASVAAGRVISNGNFHPVLVALGFEAVRPALAHVGQLSERRLGHLWQRAIGGEAATAPPADLTAAPPWVAGLQLRYPAAARYTRLRRLAEPVTLDVGPLDFSQEDHATNAPEAVRCTAEALDVLADLLAVELLTSYALLLRAPGTAGTGIQELLGRLEAVLSGLPAGGDAAAVHAVVRAALAEVCAP